MAKIDTPDLSAPKESSRYVTIPDVDLFDYPHPAVRINGISYGPGKHFLPAALADTVEERLRVGERANRRILQPTRDTGAERTVEQNRGVSGATTSF